MSRYRPPQPRSSLYITREGFERLQAELKALWARRADVTAAVTAAAAEGDRSENAEYIYRKKELREIDRRIRYLQKRLPDLQVVPPREPVDCIYFGARVSLVDATGRQLEIRLVGPDEIDPRQHHVSIDAPMARALLGRRAGDDIEVVVDGRRDSYEIRAVSYD